MNRSDDLTVGEVLSLLQEDFPEATLGRLREFEDLSLIAPELGASGHRRYPASTLDRLRWVLSKMRDGFDPADLIDESGQPTTPEPTSDPRPSGSAAVVRKKSGKEQSAEPTLFEAGTADDKQPSGDQTRVQALPRLAAAEDTAAHRVVSAQAKPPAPSPRRHPEPPPPAKPAAAPPAATKPAATKPAATPAAATPPAATKPAEPPAPEPAPEPGQSRTGRTHGGSAAEAAEERRARVEAVSALQESPPTDHAPRPRPSRTRDLPSDTEPTDLLARSEFLAEVGLDEETLGEMERFGVISPVAISGASSYDRSALAVGKIVAELLELGLEARHLRMFRMSAEREVDLLRQMALPLLLQRNPVGREQARERLQQAADLGGRLSAALVAEGVAELIDHSGAEAGGPSNGR